jgi:hypothetical protein
MHAEWIIYRSILKIYETHQPGAKNIGVYKYYYTKSKEKPLLSEEAGWMKQGPKLLCIQYTVKYVFFSGYK